MSGAELKIRDELEKDIETDLEQEIKDGIYHLALRLHRLYQHQREKISRGSSDDAITNNHLQSTKNNATLSEININIKMDGGTKIEIKETKKEARSSVRPRTTNSRTENVHGTLPANNAKKFEWIKTLRSGPSPQMSTKTENAHQAKAINKRALNQNFNKIDYGRRNCKTAPRQRKASVEVNKELLELGWKS